MGAGWLGVAVLVGLAAFFAVMVVYFVAAQRNLVPAVFTPARAVGEVLEALDLPDRGVLVDLGCGDGRLLAAALRARPGLTVVGVENNPVVWLVARLRMGRRGRVVLGQLEKLDLRKADRVFAYLSDRSMAELEGRFEEQLRPGTRLVSQQFRLPGRRPVREVRLKYGKAHAARLYVYEY